MVAGKANSWIGVGLAMAILGNAEYVLAGYDANLTGVSDGVFTYAGGLLLIHPMRRRGVRYGDE